jgi:hypothetical protein
MPWYVGKTTGNFEGEIFQAHKIKKFHSALIRTLKGSPVLFLVSCPPKKGPVNAKSIDQLESTLIRMAKSENPYLLNSQKIPRETWSITGVYRSKSGKPSKSAVAFKRLLNFD